MRHGPFVAEINPPHALPGMGRRAHAGLLLWLVEGLFHRDPWPVFGLQLF
jgi:hypothetical protein